MHQTTLEVYEDYDLTKEDPQTWEENILDNWHPVQLWPNILLPCDRPNIVTMTVTTLTSSTPATTQAGPSGPSTSTGTTGGVDSLKLAEIVKLQRQTFQILQDMGADTHGIDIQTEESTQVPIPIDSKVCPKCSKSFSSHYRALLHYKYQHLHQTKWQCSVCDRYFTSAANLESHEDSIHGSQNYQCCFCGNYFELEKHLLKHLTVHKRYHQAKKSGLMCQFCHQRVLDFYSHNPSCKHNPQRSSSKFNCRNQGCTSQFSRVKHRNYHEKKRYKYLKG